MLALAFGQVPAAQREAALSRLTELIRAAYNHLDTGFLSVRSCSRPFQQTGTPALPGRSSGRRQHRPGCTPSTAGPARSGKSGARSGRTAKSGRRRSTTTRSAAWTSGSAGTWPDRPASPGFRTSRIEPDLDADLDWVEAWQDTPYGLLKVRWERDADDPALFTIDVEVPPNTMSALALPERAGSVQAYRNGRPVPVRLGDLGSGPVTVTLRMDPGVSPDESTARYGVRGQLSRCPAGMPFISTIPASGLWWCGTARGHGKIGAVRPGDKGLVGCERAAGDLDGARGG